MKRTLFLIIILTGIFTEIQAQTALKARFKVSYFDRTNTSLFDKHPDLDYINISYRGDTAMAVILSFRKKTTALNEERYYLPFEGDRYMLHKKYAKLVLPKVPKLEMQYFAGIKDLSHTRSRLKTTLRRDTVDNLFIYSTFTGEDKYYEPSPIHRARFKGEVSLLQQKLSSGFKQWKPLKISDSTLVITGLVERDGTIGKLELISGNPSQFSNKAIQFLTQEATAWIPAEQHERTVKYLVKFFVRLNPDETITLSIL